MGYTVYMHITPSNKKYIGITCRKVKERWKNGKGYESQFFYNAIKKYGWENIDYKILYTNLCLQDAEALEIELIKKFKTRDYRYGYNIDGGGNVNKNVSDETKRKISQKLKGRIVKPESIEKQRQKLIGRKWSPELREKIMNSRRKHKKVLTPEQRLQISIRLSGGKHPMYGKHFSEEVRRKMSESKKGIKKGPMPQKTKDILSKLHEHQKKKVLQYDKNMNFIREYESISSVHKLLGYDSCAIHRCMVGKQHTSYGYIWFQKGE